MIDIFKHLMIFNLWTVPGERLVSVELATAEIQQKAVLCCVDRQVQISPAHTELDEEMSPR